ncbi:MAG: hypothetical protein GY841_19375, partial [FCB group bacterium]|nr:hypothetical protein [FCB group bacterium]
MMPIEIIPALTVTGPTMAVPGPLWLFHLLQWLTFTLHLTAMNLLFGGLLLFAFGKTNPLRIQLYESLTKVLPVAMAATITLGVAPLLFLQVLYGELFYSASIISGWNWFLIIPVVIVVYYSLYLVAMNKAMSEGVKQMLLYLVLAGLVYISYTFTMISDLVEKPALWARLYEASPAGTALNPSHTETFFRWAHIITGATAVAGIIVQLFALFNKKVTDSRRLLIFGGRVFLMSITTAAVLAIIYLFVIDRQLLNRFLLSPGLHAILGAIVINIVIAVLVYRSINSKSPKRLVIGSSVLVFVGVFCMVIGRHFLRLEYLQGRFDPASLSVQT